jgi:hypothetical protein
MNTTTRYHHIDGILPYKPPPWHTARSTHILTLLLPFISLFSLSVFSPICRSVSSSPNPSIVSPHPALRPLLHVLSLLPSHFLPKNSLLPHLPVTIFSPHSPPLPNTPSPPLPSTTPISAISSHGHPPPSYPPRPHHTNSSLGPHASPLIMGTPFPTVPTLYPTAYYTILALFLLPNPSHSPNSELVPFSFFTVAPSSSTFSPTLPTPPSILGPIPLYN